MLSWAGVAPLGLCCCWRWGGGVQVAVCRSVHLASVGEYQTDQKLYVRGNSKRVLISIRGTLSCTYVWHWRTVEINVLFVGLSPRI